DLIVGLVAALLESLDLAQQRSSLLVALSERRQVDAGVAVAQLRRKQVDLLADEGQVVHLLCFPPLEGDPRPSESKSARHRCQSGGPLYGAAFILHVTPTAGGGRW